MGDYNWQTVETIIDEVLNLPQDKRQTFIEEKCSHNPKLKGEVTQLLESIFDSEGWLEDPDNYKKDFYQEISEDVESLSSGHSLIGQQVGSYIIKEQIGEGGMGLVYIAERADESFAHQVAIKIIKQGRNTQKNILRFHREQQILAGLNHPGIGRLYDGGVTDDGFPYIIMEYVDGLPIDEYCSKHNCIVDEKIGLFKQVLEAVRYAHENLVIHRDLKPGNILVDGSGVVKILDFGISKLLEDDEELSLTQTGARLLTPRYAAPEQIRQEKITTSCDLYALGIIFYKLLTGGFPFNFDGKSRYKIEQTILNVAPLRPSAIADTAETGKQLKGDLDEIMLKAIRKDPEDRYRGITEFLDDLVNYQHDLPINAQRGKTSYRINKFFKRHKKGAATAAGILLLLIGFTAFYTWRIAQERDQAQQQAERAVAIKNLLANMITAANPFVSPGETPTVGDLLEHGSRTVEEELTNQPVLAAEMWGVIGGSYRGMGEMELARQHLEKSLNIINEDGELDAEIVAEIKADYAHAMIGSGEPEAALNIAKEALSELEGMAKVERTRGNVLNVYATAHYMLSNFSEALASAQQAADLTCEAYGEQNRSCISSLLELKYFHERVDQYDEALKTSERAYHLAESLHTGEPHPQLVMAAGAYGDALSLHAQTDKSIPLLKKNTEHALEIYGEENFRYARALDWLSQAYQEAGRTHDVLPLTEHLFEIGEKAVPANPLIPVWLHRIVQSALTLKMPDRAENTFNKQEEKLPDHIPENIRDAFALQNLQIKIQRTNGTPALKQQLQDLLVEFREKNSSQLNPAKLMATELAINMRDTIAADTLLSSLSSSKKGYASDIKPAIVRLLNARQLALLDKLDEAMDEAKQSMTMLEEVGHRDSPFVAETQAVLAELYCRMNKTEKGRVLLNESRHYWSTIAEVSNGLSAMERLAPACHKEDGR